MATNNSEYERRRVIHGARFDSIFSSGFPGSSDEDLEASEVFLRASLDPWCLENTRKQGRVTTRALFQDENPFENPGSSFASNSSSSRVVPVLLPVDGLDTHQGTQSDYSTSEYSSHPGAELEVAVSDPFADSTTVASLWEQVLDDRYSDRGFSHNFEESISSPTDQYSLPRLGSPGLSVSSPVVEQEYNVSSAGEEPTSEDRCDGRYLSTPELLPFTLETPREGSNFITSSDAAERHKPDISVPKHRGRDSVASGAKSSGRLREATSGIRSAIKNLLRRKQSDSNNLLIDRHASEKVEASPIRIRHQTPY